jgi:hypothetical protein
MRWYWLIGCDNTVEEPYVASEGDLGLDDWLLSDGRAVSDWSGDAWVKAASEDEDGEPDDVLQTHYPLPIYSSRLRSALERAGVTGIQYLPIHVFHHDGREISGYAIANILNKVSALDFEHSTYTLFPADYFLEERRGDVSSLLKPVLVRGPLNGYHVVRLDEYEAPIYVSEVFKAVFEDGGFTGYSFSEVEVREDVTSVAPVPAR